MNDATGERGVRAQRQAAGKAEDPGVVLGLLSAVERDSALTQRYLARELGIALGLANAYLRRCVKKGLIKIRQAPLNRYGYYLTPRGFAEKGRLTAEYLTASLDFFRRARRDCANLLAGCAARGWRRVALAGAGELAEIAVLSAAETGVTIVAVIDAEGSTGCGGRPVVRDLATALALAGEAGLDAIMITDTRAPQERFETMMAESAGRFIGEGRVLAPQLLHITLRPPPAKGAAR